MTPAPDPCHPSPGEPARPRAGSAQTFGEFVIAVVGAGPRGTSFLERMLAHLQRLPEATLMTRRRLRVLIIDPAPHGPGRVWDPEQSPLYLMNTPASFPTAAPVGRTAESLPPSSVSRSFAGWRAEQTNTDYPARRAYGEYLTALHHDVVSELRGLGVDVEPHRAEVTGLTRTAGRYSLTLVEPTAGTARTASPRGAHADAVVLALGHVPAQLDEAGGTFLQAAEDFGLQYLPPAIPTDVDEAALPAQQNVLVRGMGLNFFDLMISTTVGRGGSFRRNPAAPPGRRLDYLASGGEPHLIAGSRRGAPYRARSAAPADAPGMVADGVESVHLTEEAVDAAQQRHEVLDFAAHLWPLIHRDVLHTYFHALIRVSPELFGTPEDFLCALDELLGEHHLGEQVVNARGARLLHHHAPAALWPDVRALGRPFEEVVFDSAQQYQQHMLAYLEDDAASSAAGALSPAKMSIAALHAGRMKLKELISDGRVSRVSRLEDVETWFEALVEGLASGPPVQRIEELAALARAGVVEFLGPDPVYDVDRRQGCFTAESPHVAGAEPYRATTLIEARMPANRVRLSASPLVSGLLDEGLACSADIVDAAGAPRAGRGFEVTAQPHRLIDADGVADPGIFVLGLQLSSAQWGTAIAAEAGGDDGASARTLADADAAARRVLETFTGT